MEEAKVQRWNRALPVIHRVYAALSYLSLLICLGSVFPLSMISGAALGPKPPVTAPQQAALRHEPRLPL